MPAHTEETVCHPPVTHGGTHWDDALCLAVRLGLSPEAFWRLSVREWAALTAPLGANHPGVSRAQFAALTAQFPDHVSPDNKDEPHGI